MHHQHDRFGAAGHRIDEGVEIAAMGRESIGIRTGIGQFGGIAHADQIRRDQPAVSFQLGNDVAPQIGRGRVAVQKQDRPARAAFVIGHAGA